MGRPRRAPLPRGIRVREYASGRSTYWIDFRDQHGERVQEVGGSTIDEAVRLIAARRAAVADGTFVRNEGTGSQTIASYGPRWIKLRREDGVRSVEREAQLFRDHIEPHLGDRPLDELRPHEVAKWIRKIGAALAPKSVLNAHGVLSSIYARARFDELVRDNPAKGLPSNILPKNTRSREVAAWTRDEVERWITPCDEVPEDRTIAYTIATFTAGRVGEVAGLRWRDLDIDARPLWRWALRTQYDGAPLKGRGQEGGNPRDVPIHPELQRILAAWKIEGWPRFMRRHPRPDDFVVPREDGTVHSKESLGAKAVHRHARLLEIDDTGRDFHSFRRAMITIARTDGAPADVVERITHNAKGEQLDQYTYFGWEPLCAAVSAIRVEPRRGVVIQLPKAANGDPSGDAGPFAAVRELDFRSIRMEAPGVEERSEAAGPGLSAAIAVLGSSGPPSPRLGEPGRSAFVPGVVTRVTVSEARARLLALADDLDASGLDAEARRVRVLAQRL